MKRRFTIGLATLSSILLFSVGCTGFNGRTAFAGGVNTNPAREYATLRGVTRGGLFYHKNMVNGGTGNASAVKKGRACSHSVLYAVAWGDSSIEGAKHNGEITRIASLDYEIMAILGSVYHRHCTIVQGE